MRLTKSTASFDRHVTLLVGVAVMRKPSSTENATSTELLVIKRAETDVAFPGLWTVPDGHIEPGETVEEAITRETHEETCLEVRGVLGEFGDLHWVSEEGEQKVQMNFLVTVRSLMGITLNPAEHSAWRWIKQEDMSKLPCSKGIAKVFENAFKSVERRGENSVSQYRWPCYHYIYRQMEAWAWDHGVGRACDGSRRSKR
jgi:ADP-ribose pyrophosphatase YjhB (NUDIX family)